MKLLFNILATKNPFANVFSIPAVKKTNSKLSSCLERLLQITAFQNIPSKNVKINGLVFATNVVTTDRDHLQGFVPYQKQ